MRPRRRRSSSDFGYRYSVPGLGIRHYLRQRGNAEFPLAISSLRWKLDDHPLPLAGEGWGEGGAPTLYYVIPAKAGIQ